MFDNLGEKIEKWASVNYWCGVVAFPVLGVIIMCTVHVFGGICIAIIGVSVSIIQSYILAALGRLVTNTDVLKEAARITKCTTTETDISSDVSTLDDDTKEIESFVKSFNWQYGCIYKDAVGDKQSLMNRAISHKYIDRQGEYFYLTDMGQSIIDDGVH